MKKGSMFFYMVALVSFFVCGCSAFAPSIDVNGQAHTQFGDTAIAIAQAIGSVSSVIPVPYGVAIGGIAGLVGLIGTSVTAVAVARRRMGILGAVIQGVEEANKPEAKVAIRRVAGDLGFGANLAKIVKKLTEKG